MRILFVTAALAALCCGVASAAPVPASIVEDMDTGCVSGLSRARFLGTLVSAASFADSGASVDLEPSAFPKDSTVSRDESIESIKVVSGASHVTYISNDVTMAMRLKTRIPMDALPPEFQQYVEPAWDCESQARYLDAHGYALIYTFADGAAARDRVLIGDRSLGAAMTWLEARATGVVARHFNGYIEIDMIVTNEARASAYTIDTGLRQYSGIDVTGEMIAIPDGKFDERIESKLWVAIAQKRGGGSSGGCAAGASALALAALLCRRRKSGIFDA